MIKNERLKHKIQESITNLVNTQVIPADEAQLNLDVIYDSILNEICSVVPMESPRQIVSCLKLIYDSEAKSVVNTGDIEKDAFKLLQMNGVGAVPLNDNGYPSENVVCSVIPDESGMFLAQYKNIIPGTINIADEITDDHNGKLVKDGTEVGTVDYSTGCFNFTADTVPANAVLKYKFDIYNLMTDRNFTKFVKSFVEVFADLFVLDLDSAVSLYDMKSLDYKKNVDNILPQVLTQSIDQYVLRKYFELAAKKVPETWDATAVWTGTDRVPVSLLYQDFGVFVSKEMCEFTKKTGVVSNVILVDPVAFSILSINDKFTAINENTNSVGTPKFVGYFNGARVYLVNVPADTVGANVVLTYKGESEAQTAGVFTPYIPVILRDVNGMEGMSTITTTNAYSMAGFAMVNPDLVRGIKITE